MDKKKTARADLESKKGVFLQIGLVVALSVVFFAFELKFYDSEVELIERIAEDIFEEDVQITQPEEPPPPEEAPPETDQIEIVDDETEVEEEFIIDAEADQETEVEFVPVEVEEEVEEAEIFQIVEKMPEFANGGLGGMMKFLQSNIAYPQIAKESGITGTVFVTFVVEPTGKISGVRILRGIGGGCDEEALRVVKKMPNWSPGKQRGKPVRVQFNLPVKFILR